MLRNNARITGHGFSFVGVCADLKEAKVGMKFSKVYHEIGSFFV